MTAPSSTDRGDAGFTLVEILIAMTLLALLSLLLFSSLRFGMRAWDRGEAHGSGMEEVRLVQDLLRREIEQAYPLFIASDPLNPYIDFQGRRDTLTFLAPAPQSRNSIGRARIVLERRQDGPYVQLVMRGHSVLSGDTWEEPLLRHLAAVRMSYYGAIDPDAPPAWRDTWSNLKSLPQLVLVHVEFPSGDAREWPDLIVTPHIFADVACIYDVNTRKCQGR